MERTLQEMIALSKKNKDTFCCEHQPLLNIETNHVILDELHLLLRVVDVLLNNLLEEVLEWDKTEDVKKKRKVFIGINYSV